MPPTVPSLLHTLRDGPSAFFPGGSSNVTAPQEPDNRESTEDWRDRDASAAVLLPPNAPTVTPLPAATPPRSKLQMADHHQCSGFAFPNCRTILWDSSAQGPKVFVAVEDVLPDVIVPAHVLAHLQGALAEDQVSLGTLRSKISTDGNDSLIYDVREYVAPGRSDDEQSDGVLLTISNTQLEPDCGRSEREASVRARLADRLPTSVDALFRPHFFAKTAQPSATSDQFRLCVSAELVAPSATVVATPIRSLRVLPTPLSKSLAAAQSVRTLASRSGDSCKARADDMQAGYVTVDACRRCVAMHVNDPKTWEWPMVGVWVSDVDSVYDSLVWAACTRFCHCDSISERVAQNGAFLLLLYARGQHSPQMYEWRLSPTVVENGASPLEFECFKAPLELPLSALRSDAAAGSPFLFSLGRAVPRGARGKASAPVRPSHTLDSAQAAATMLCPEPQAPPSPATLSFVAAASTTGSPPAWSPLRVHEDAQPLLQADHPSSAANSLQARPTSLLPTQQVAAQQATIDRLENTVRLLQQQVSVLSMNARLPTAAPLPSEQQQNAETNTSFLWQNEAMQHQLTVLNQDVPPIATSTTSTNTSGFLWQQQQPDAATSIPGAAAELQTAMRRFTKSCRAADPESSSGQQASATGVDTVSTNGQMHGRSRVSVEPVRSPARSTREASTTSEQPASGKVDASEDCTTSSDDDGRFADRYDAVGGAPEPYTPARSGRGFQLPSAAATPPSPPEPVWRSMANYCADLNVSTIDIPRVRLPDSFTLPSNSADDEEEDEADEQHEEDIDDAIESMYARKYRLADFVQPADTLDNGRRLLPDSDSDDDIAVEAQVPRYQHGRRDGTASSAARPPLMTPPVDLSFVGSIGAALSK